MEAGTNPFAHNGSNSEPDKFSQTAQKNIPAFVSISDNLIDSTVFSIVKAQLENKREEHRLMRINFIILSLLTAITTSGMAIAQQGIPGDIKPQDKITKSENISDEKRWWKEGVVYQIYPRSFKDSDGNGVGDLNGITEKLDYLKELGVNIVWLNPVYSSPNKDNGYDISDYHNIMKEFGTMEDWDRLIKEMHKRDIKLIMDLVVNHTSDQHEWFKKATNPNEKDYKKCRNFYIWHPPTKDGQPPSITKCAFGDSAWSKDEKTGEWSLNMFHPTMKDLNWEYEPARNAVYEMMDFWFKKGVDGFRMDVIDAIGKKDLTKLTKDDKEFFMVINGDKTKLNNHLQEMHEKVLGKYKKNGQMGRDETNEIMTVGECPWLNLEQAREVVNSKNKKLDMIFGFDHMNLDNGDDGDKWSTKKIDLVKLKEVFTGWIDGMEDTGWNSTYLMNHDQPRAVSRFGNDTNDEFRRKSAELLCTMEMTLKGTPYVYMGEEIGMTNPNFDKLTDYKDVDTYNYYNQAKKQGIPEETIMRNIRYKSRDNARIPMQWDASPNAGFTTGTPWIQPNRNYKEINVAAAKKEDDAKSILKYYKRMIKTRKNNPVLIYGRYNLLAKEDKNIYAYTRTLGNEKMLIVLNFSDKANKFSPQKHNVNTTNAKIEISNYTEKERLKDNPDTTISLKPYEARVYKLQKRA